MKNHAMLKAAAVALCLASTLAQAQSKFSITNLSYLTPQGSADWTAINNDGDLTGNVNNLVAIYDNGSLKKLRYIDGNRAGLINDSGAVTFHSYPSSPGLMSRAYVHRDGVTSEITPLYDNVYRGGTYVAGINDAGTIVGSGSGTGYTCSSDPGCEFRTPWSRAFMHKDGKTIDLGTLDGAEQAWANGINNQGTVVGVSALKMFVYRDGAMQGVAIDGLRTVNGINDADQIIGNRRLGSGPQDSFIYDHGTVKTIGIAGAENTVLDINNAGQVLGTAESNFGTVRTLWLYSGGKTIDINTLLYEEDWKISGIVDLNDKGQILALATREGRGSAYVLLTPDEAPQLLPAVPEPSTYAMLLGGLGMLAFARRRRTA